MKALVVYVSIHHGNTKRIAEVIAADLAAQVVTPTEISAETLPEYDLVGFGSGIFYGSHHRNLIDLAARLPVTRGRAFVFSTRGSWRVGRAHNSLKRILKKKGFQIIGEFSCRGYDTVGPLKYLGGVARGRPNYQDLMNTRFCQTVGCCLKSGRKRSGRRECSCRDVKST